jgi:hypothetical protein
MLSSDLNVEGLRINKPTFQITDLNFYAFHNLQLTSPLAQRNYKGKCKVTRYRPDVAQRVGRGIALLFHDL